MIEFYAGAGWDTQAIGIALEEMFLDYRVMPGRAPLPSVAIGGARLAGAPNVLLALARRTNRFLIDAEQATAWLPNSPPDLSALEKQLENADFILGRISVADMAIYPRLTANRSSLDAHPAVARWLARMAMRPATGRGMSAIAG